MVPSLKSASHAASGPVATHALAMTMPRRSFRGRPTSASPSSPEVTAAQPRRRRRARRSPRDPWVGAPVPRSAARPPVPPRAIRLFGFCGSCRGHHFLAEPRRVVAATPRKGSTPRVSVRRCVPPHGTSASPELAADRAPPSLKRSDVRRERGDVIGAVLASE